jgi:hypothetical protein
VGPVTCIDVKQGQKEFDPYGRSKEYSKYEHRCPSGEKIEAAVRVSLNKTQGGKGWGAGRPCTRWLAPRSSVAVLLTVSLPGRFGRTSEAPCPAGPPLGGVPAATR